MGSSTDFECPGLVHVKDEVVYQFCTIYVRIEWIMFQYSAIDKDH